MTDLVVANDAQLAQILDWTYPIWNEGLTRDGYARWNAVQGKTKWGAQKLRRMALVENGEVVATAKWYDLDVRIGDAIVRTLGIGAVFTPEPQRGKGRAAELIDRMQREAEREGYGAAVLFSEIGAAYYERLGFVEIPRETSTLEVIQKKGAPASLVRAGADEDLVKLAALHDTGDAAARLAPKRSPELVQFAAQKRRTRSALAPLGSYTTEFYASEEGNHAVAYVLLTRGRAGNNADGPEVMWLDACGDRDPTGARVGAALQVLLARTPAEATPVLKAWIPSGWMPPQLREVSREPAEEILMIKPLGNTQLPPLHGSEVIWWKADSF